MSVFRLTMLPASEGDCLLLSYGASEEKLRHIVIDGGRKATWHALKDKLADIADRGEAVELLLLSHIDADHIDGLVELVEAPDLPLKPKAVWYNGYDQLKALEKAVAVSPFGVKAADKYSKALAAKGWPINAAFDGAAIYTETKPDPFEFAGLTLTLISPTLGKLDKLRIDWRKALKQPVTPLGPGSGSLESFGKRPMPETLNVETLSRPSNGDMTAPNGSSIALIAEYDGRRVLLGADAHPDALLASLNRLRGGGQSYPVDLVKLPHHGSRANLTSEIIQMLDTSRFAISTSGAVFGHPDPEAISRLLKFGTPDLKTLYFNYASERTLPWDDPALKAQYHYNCVYPAKKDQPLIINI